jgi:phospholipase/lecithinase/hemolysin
MEVVTMKKALKITGITVLICTILFTFLLVNNIGFAGTTSPSNISSIYAFGDNYSDSGNSYTYSYKLVSESVPDSYLLPANPNDDLYWEGRWTNGYTAIEVLSKEINVDLINYAVGGATSGEENYYEWLTDEDYKTGLLGQIEKFEADLEEKSLDSDALYFIFASSNDYYYNMDNFESVDVNELALKSAENIRIAVTKLKELGATKFMVVNSPDLSKVPWEFISSRTESASEFSTSFNTQLSSELKNLDTNTEILLYDYYTISNKIINNSESYEISEVIRPYERTYPDVVYGVGEESNYYFWDEWNPSEVVHESIGEDMVSSVVEQYPK